MIDYLQLKPARREKTCPTDDESAVSVFSFSLGDSRPQTPRSCGGLGGCSPPGSPIPGVWGGAGAAQGGTKIIIVVSESDRHYVAVQQEWDRVPNGETKMVLFDQKTSKVHSMPLRDIVG